MTVQAIDPRIPASVAPTTLAVRSPSLAGQRILLFDNGKLAPEYGPYRAVFDVVATEVTAAGGQLVEHSDDLLLGGTDRLREVAEWVAGQRVTGVVLGLGDWGVSQPMSMVAALLEGRGIATSSVTTEVGGRLVLANAARMAPGLPVTVLRSLRSASHADVTAEAERVLADIIGGLTATGPELAARFAAQHIVTPSPAAASGMLDLADDDPSAGFTRLMRDSGLGDGLPLVAPTEARVAAFVAATGADGDDTVWPAIAPRDTPVTVRQVAAVAVAAGCAPPWAPVVLAAYRAMAAPEFRLFQVAITTHPSGTLVLVSGDNDRFGLAAGRGSLGPGCPANATTGRAVALGYSFLLGALPGGADLVAQGSPAGFTYCSAENLAASPWPGLHADLGFADATTVTVLRCEGPHNLTDQQSADPATLLDTFASSMTGLGANAAYVPHVEAALLLNPEHAALIAEAGWTKSDVRRYLFETARNPRADLLGRGLAPHFPAWARTLDRVPIVPDPDALLVAVVGGSGPASQFASPWGYSRAVTVPVT